MDNNYKYNNIVDNLTNSFVNDYSFWKNIINNANEALKIQNSEINKKYSYDEFCSIFINHVKDLNDNVVFSEKIIQAILLKMIHDK